MRAVWIRNRLVLLMIGFTILAWISLSTFLPSSFFQKNSENTRHGAIGLLYLQQNLPNAETVVDLRLQSQLFQIKENIKSLAKNIYKAKQHVRGSKTSDYLKHAVETMNSLLAEINIEPQSVYNRIVRDPINVCPEKYMGSTFGYPFFYKGFEVTDCEKGVPVWKLVTIIQHINIPKENMTSTSASVDRFVSSVYKLNRNFSVIISVNNSSLVSNLIKLYPGLSVVVSSGLSEGLALNLMIREVKTPYVLIARDVQFFTNDSRLDRLVREVERLDIKVAGGAFRNPDGHWKKGCFQTVYRNFTLKYLEGYDESKNECLFCDFIQGPFIARKDFIEKNVFGNLSVLEGLFEDWFLKLNSQGDEAIVCADSMFHVENKVSRQKVKFSNLMKRWDLFKVVTPHGIAITSTCTLKSGTSGSKALSPCSLQLNADAVKTLMAICESESIYCELQEGTALGAVKLGKILPWERDADLTFLTANYSTFQNLQSVLEEKGFSFSDLGSTWCCADKRPAGGKFRLGYKGWNIELYGQHLMDSELMVADGIKPTKVLLDGQWVNVPKNPGLFVRNRYGREIYQHAEHWMATGEKSGWASYKTNVFMSCSSKGSHDCLDRCNADGDLPFMEMLP